MTRYYTPAKPYTLAVRPAPKPKVAGKVVVAVLTVASVLLGVYFMNTAASVQPHAVSIMDNFSVDFLHALGMYLAYGAPFALIVLPFIACLFKRV